MRTLLLPAFLLLALGSQAQHSVDLPAFPRPLNWVNQPLRFKAEAGKVLITAGPKTDVYRAPDSSYRTATAVRLMMDADPDFTLEARVNHAFAQKWDGGALFLEADSLNWVKFCFEKDYTGAHRVVSVATQGFSDDNNALALPGKTAFFKMAKKGDNVLLYCATDGKNYFLVRNLRVAPNKHWRVGLLAQSPEGKENTVTFSHLRYRARAPLDAFANEHWEQLFNGKDLQGWDIKITNRALNDNYKNTFRVENNMLRVCYDQYKTFDDKYGHLYYKKPYSHYLLRATYRFTGDQTPGGAVWNVRNSGIMVHSQSAGSLDFDQAFPVSLEMQLLGGLGKGERHTANLCTPGTEVEMNGQLNTSHCIDSRSKTYDGDQWVTVEILVLGDSLIRHNVEGQTVLEYSKPRIGESAPLTGIDFLNTEFKKKSGMPLRSGYIALQAESHAIDFKQVELLNLKGCRNPKCEHFRPYFVESAKCVCNKP